MESTSNNDKVKLNASKHRRSNEILASRRQLSRQERGKTWSIFPISNLIWASCRTNWNFFHHAVPVFTYSEIPHSQLTGRKESEIRTNHSTLAITRAGQVFQIFLLQSLNHGGDKKTEIMYRRKSRGKIQILLFSQILKNNQSPKLFLGSIRILQNQVSNRKHHIRASRIKIHYTFTTETEVCLSSSYLGGEKRT